jgi:hypothetical protein
VWVIPEERLAGGEGLRFLLQAQQFIQVEIAKIEEILGFVGGLSHGSIPYKEVYTLDYKGFSD